MTYGTTETMFFECIEELYVVYILNRSCTTVGSRAHLLPHCG